MNMCMKSKPGWECEHRMQWELSTSLLEANKRDIIVILEVCDPAVVAECFTTDVAGVQTVP